MQDISIVTAERAAAIKVDPEFQARIPTLTLEEHEHLEKSILAEGCQDAIVTWNNVIVDGHHRYEICNRLGLPFRRRTIVFGSREEALRWIDENQLARRNLTDQQRKLIVGRLYKKTKPAQGGTGANQNKGPKDVPATSAKALGEKLGMSERSVRRAAEFAATVEADPDLAARVARGEKIPVIKPTPARAPVKVEGNEVGGSSEIDKAVAELERAWKAASQECRDQFIASFSPSPAISELLRALNAQEATESQTGQIDRSAESGATPVDTAEAPVVPLPLPATVDAPLVVVTRQILEELGTLGLGETPLSTIRCVCGDIIKKHPDIPSCFYENLESYLRGGNARAKQLAHQVALHAGGDCGAC